MDGRPAASRGKGRGASRAGRARDQFDDDGSDALRPEDSGAYSVRGGRGRGRGQSRGGLRGRGGNARVRPAAARPFQDRLPSVHERIAELSIAAPQIDEKGSAPPSLDELSKILDSAFPASAHPTTAYDSVYLSTFGYQRLVIETFRAMKASDPKIDRMFSEREFFLVCGWFLYKRILEIHQKWKVIPVDVTPFLEVFPQNLKIPRPIRLYLEGLGAFKTVTGNILLPDLRVPNGGVNATAGMFPVTWLQDAQPNAAINDALLNIYPVGLAARRMNFQFAPGAYGGALANTNVLQVGAVNAGPDARIGRTFTYGLIDELRDAVAERGNAINVPAFWAGFQADQTVLGRLRFNHYILRDYISFANSIEQRYEFDTWPGGTAGSASIQAFARPMNGTHIAAPTNFDVFCSYPLSRSEIQAARLFKYRLDINVAANATDAAGADIHFAVNQAPGPLHQPATMSFTEVQGDSAFVGFFTEAFRVKPK